MQVWLYSKAKECSAREGAEVSALCDSSYLKTNRDDVNQPMFLETKSSLQFLLGRIHDHA